MSLYHSLDPFQRQVADWRPSAGNLRVLATAGSGKTTSLTALVAKLLNESAVAASRLFVATYSNKAGEELKSRIEPQINPGAFSAVHIGTFHALGLRELRMHDRTKWSIRTCLDADAKERAPTTPSSARIWDMIAGKDKKNKIPGTEAYGLGLKDAGKALAKAYALVRAWDFSDPDSLTSDFLRKNPLPANFRNAWRLYETAKKNLGCWDFDDVLTEWGKLLTSPRAAVVIIDEAQDNDRRMANIAEKLIGFPEHEENRIVLIGDPSQTIHEWKGAYPDLFMEADKRYNAATIQLPINYRSGSEIVRIGNRSIRARPWSLAMQAKTVESRGVGKVALIGEFPDGVSEAAAVVEIIATLLARGGKAQDYCILTRTNAELGLFAAMLRDRNIVHTMLGNQSLFTTREGVDFVSYVKLALGDDISSVERIYNRPLRYMKRDTLDSVLNAVRAGKNLIQACQGAYVQLVGKNQAQAQAVAYLEGSIRKVRRGSWPEVVGTIMSFFIRSDGELADDDEAEEARHAPPDEDRPATYGALASIARKFQNGGDFLRFVAKVEESFSHDSARGVLLSTIHRMKGGERPVVFLSASDGSLPHWRALPANSNRQWFGKELDAELRLWYVAVTRARDTLFLSWNAQATKNRKGGKSRFIERFIEEEEPKDGPPACGA